MGDPFRGVQKTEFVGRRRPETIQTIDDPITVTPNRRPQDLGNVSGRRADSNRRWGHDSGTLSTIRIIHFGDERIRDVKIISREEHATTRNLGQNILRLFGDRDNGIVHQN